jgi:hypothetical protein
MIECNIVNALGIIVAKFHAVNHVVPVLEYVQFRDKLYLRKHREGGGNPSFYEIVPDVILTSIDIISQHAPVNATSRDEQIG